MLANPIHQNLISKQLQMQAQSHLEQARFYRLEQHFEMALISYDQAKVIFKHVESAGQQIPPLSGLKRTFSKAFTPQTSEDVSLRQRIAEVYFERAEVLRSLEKWGKAKKSYQKAQAWGYEGIPAALLADSIPPTDSAMGSFSAAAFFSSGVSLSPQVPQACPPQKHQWVAQVFETILKQFQDLDLCQDSPSLFLVYAHHNPLGKADAEVLQRVIRWLSDLRSNVYSDRTAAGHQALPLPATPADKAKTNDILSSQLCLLPRHAGTVDHVVLCGSELLGRYMASPYYQGFYEAIQRAYLEASQTHDFAQIEAAIREVVEANLNEQEFHHVLTELAFLQIRAEYKKGEHGIIPLLLNSTAQQCLPKFIIDSTTIRIEDCIWCTPNLWNGRQTYQDEGLHIGFFKLLTRLFMERERCISLVEDKVYQTCLKRLREDQTHTLTAEKFFLFLNQACVAALEALQQEHASNIRTVSIRKVLQNLDENIQQIKGKSLISPEQLRSALGASYSAECLTIQRLSGAPLPMAHCYINLVIVESKAQQEAEEDKLKAQSSTFYRLSSYEEIKQTNLQKSIPLEELFNEHQLSNGQKGIPKRILIQGRAGIGKTTLCKKLVYEYQQGLWKNHFDGVLWLPLRQLKHYQVNNLIDLLTNKYFSSLARGKRFTEQLMECANKILFILDGLDEVSVELNQGRTTPIGNLLCDLLAQPQVIVTSRPAGVDVSKLEGFDLELETIGFNQENIRTYLEKIEANNATDIQALIDSTPVIKELVNIPVQLDALCYSWKEIKVKLDRGKAKALANEKASVTMTTLYQTQFGKLLRKDAGRLGKTSGERLLTADDLEMMSETEIVQLMADEVEYLLYLSFHGLQDNLIEFDLDYINKVKEELNRKRQPNLSYFLQNDLKQTSFLHTSDTRIAENKRAYHFLHLTFQEFFAAKFLAKHLQPYLTAEGESKTLVGAVVNGLVLEPEKIQGFVSQYKYEARYQIVWWIVAGLLEGEALEGFFILLEQEAPGLLEDKHVDLIMHCLYEARASLSETTIKRLEKRLAERLALAVISKDEYKSIQLGSEPAFPEHLLLKFIEQDRQYQDLIFQTLLRRQTLSEPALAVVENALQDRDCNFEILLKYGIGAYAIKVEAIQSILLKRFEEEKEPLIIGALAVGLGWHASKVAALQSALLKRFEQEKEPLIIGALALGLGWQAGKVAAFQSALLKRFEQEKEPESIRWLAKGLGRQASEVAAFQSALLKRFEQEKEPQIIGALAGGLGQHASEVAALQSALLKRFEQEKEPQIIGALAGGLGQHASKVAALQSAFLKRFEEEKEPESIGYLASGLGWHAGKVAALQSALLKRFEEEKEPQIIGALASGLGQHASKVAALQSAFLKRFEEEKEPESIGYLASGLGWQAGKVAAIQSALLKRFEEEKEPESIRWLARGLGRQASEVAAIQSALLKRFEEEKEPQIIGALAGGLGHHASKVAALQNALLKRFEQEKEPESIRWLARGLGFHADAVPAIRGALIKMLGEGQDLMIRAEVVEALGRHAAHFDEIRVAFLSRLEKDENAEVKAAIAKVLSAINKKSEPEDESFSVTKLLESREE